MKKIILYIFILLGCGWVNAHAHDKVVVIPLKTSIQSTVADNVYGGGYISSWGNKIRSFGKPFFATKTKTGIYTITIPGLRLDCFGPLPIVVFSMAGNPGFITTGMIGTRCATGDVEIYIYTTNTSEVKSDTSFYLLVMLEDEAQASDPISAASKSHHPENCEYDPKTGMETCK